MCLCFVCGGVGGVGGVGGRLGPGSGRVRWCYVCVRVWILCVDGRSRYLYIVLGGYLCILGAPSVQSFCTLLISGSNLYLSVADIANPDLFVCGNRTYINLDIAPFVRSIASHPAGSPGRLAQKYEPPFLRAEGLDTICTGFARPL